MNQLRWSKERLKLPMKNEKGCVSGGNLKILIVLVYCFKQLAGRSSLVDEKICPHFVHLVDYLLIFLHR